MRPQVLIFIFRKLKAKRMASQTQTTEVLDTFPTIPAVQEAEQILAEAENPEVTIPQEA